MRELCQTHKLVLAPDGKCVVCRRPARPLFAVREEHETWISRVFTGLLGVGLLIGFGSLLYLSGIGPGYTGGRYELRGSADATGSLQRATQNSQAEAPGSNPADPVSAAAETGEATDAQDAAGAARPAQAEPAVPNKPRAEPAALQEVEVTMYATPWCNICDHARSFLHARNVVLIERDIEREPKAAQQLATINPALSVPTFEIAGRAYVGFNAWDIEDALQEAAEEPVAAHAP